MSAIYGLVRRGGDMVSDAELAHVSRVLAHRGPDGQAALALDNAGLGHGLLRVTREDRFEAQPLHDARHGLTLVADLRLDNREELAKALDIDKAGLASLPDSALLLQAWLRWGQDCLERLIGDFTFALRDHRARRLYLARDGMGQRGLYLHRSPGLIAFASEVNGLFAIDGVPRELDEAGLARRMMLPVDANPDVTVYRGISVLPGGLLRWYDDASSGGGEGEWRFWQPHAGAQHLGRDDAYYLAAYREIVTEAIAARVRRLESPPCLLFSGGFDSGTIAAVAAPLAAAAGRKVIAVASVLNDGEQAPLGDARRAASAFAAMPGLALHWFQRGRQTLLDDLEQRFERTGDCQPTDYVRQSAYALGRGQGARLAMDGHGGDYTVNMLDGGMLGRILRRGEVRRFCRELSARRRFTGRGLGRLLRDEVLRGLLPQGLIGAALALRRGLVPLWQKRMTRDDFAARMIAEGAIDPHRLRQPSLNHLRWQGRWLHMLNKVSAAAPVQNTLAASHGLDFTRPYHDTRVVELGLAIPERLQLRDGRERWLARTALADLLPPELIASPPGNVLEQPGLHAMLAEGLPGALAQLEQAAAQGCPADTYVDLAKLRRALAEGAPNGPTIANHQVLSAAANGVVVARFVNWFRRRNANGQEP